jgi:hypothetical protein
VRVSKRTGRNATFSLAPVLFKNSPIEGRGVFARQKFAPGDVIVPYAPSQRRLPASDPEATLASETKFTLLSEGEWVIVPDLNVPGGYLCNHSCEPNATLYSDGKGRIECLRSISPGEEVTVFYGWVTHNQSLRDPCRCGTARCRGSINFDFDDEELEHFDSETPAGQAFHRRLDEYGAYLASIGQAHVLDLIGDKLTQARANLGLLHSTRARESRP